MSLEALLNPRSIALVGATENQPGIGQLFASLDKMGFKGGVYPINPRYPTVFGKTCYPSLKDLPEVPDVVAFRVGYQRVLDSFVHLPEIGAKAAVIYDGGFAEQDEEGKKLQARIKAICDEGGISLCGPNCMGVFNPHGRSATYMMPVRDLEAVRGNVGLVSHSGGFAITMMNDARRYGFSVAISCGNEAATTVASYIDWMVDDPNTKVIACFIEAIREPEKFVAALDRADKAGKPVVILKVGKSARTRRAILGHTAGISDEPVAFSAMLKAHRAIEVRDTDEMSEVLTVCQGKRWPKGGRTSFVVGSGGVAELVLDIAEQEGIQVPVPTTEVRQEAESVIGKLPGDANPIDAWGHGDFDRNLPHGLKVLDADPNTDVIVQCVDGFDRSPMGNPDFAPGLVQKLADASMKSKKPHYLLGMRTGLMNPVQVDILKKADAEILTGTRAGLRAIDYMAKWHNRTL